MPEKLNIFWRHMARPEAETHVREVVTAIDHVATAVRSLRPGEEDHCHTILATAIDYKGHATDSALGKVLRAAGFGSVRELLKVPRGVTPEAHRQNVSAALAAQASGSKDVPDGLTEHHFRGFFDAVSRMGKWFGK